MFIDEVTIKVEAGRGGDGKIAFDKNMMALGPTGAQGGRGGNIYLQGVSDLGALRKFRFKKDFKAQDGQIGRGQFRDGSNGSDLTLEVPVGTVVHGLKQELEIKEAKEKFLIAKGGIGGRGNFHFKSATNTSPQEFEFGREGESFEIKLELKLIADVGLVGLPNAGKTTLLNQLTKASAKTANYPFTTLEPNLGAYYNLIIADIPGLIEGASSGKGLGIKFLKHIERTKVIFHLISADSDDPVKDYLTVRQELINYGKELKDKPEEIFLTKKDLVSEERINQILSEIKKDVISISIHDSESIKKVKEKLAKL